MNIEPSIHTDNNRHNSLAPPLGDPFILSEFRQCWGTRKVEMALYLCCLCFCVYTPFKCEAYVDNKDDHVSPTWPLTSSVGHCSPGNSLSPCASVTATVTQRLWVQCVAPTQSRTSQPALLVAPNQWVKQATIQGCYKCSGFHTVILISFVLFQNLTGCTCVSSTSEDAVAFPGKCPSPGCQEAFLTFLCVICVCSMIGAMAQTPSVIILIRQVKRAASHRLTTRGSS